MIQNIALTKMLGLPVVAYGGIFTLLLVIATATVGYLRLKGVTTVPFKVHPQLALATIILALIHAFFGLSLFLGY